MNWVCISTRLADKVVKSQLEALSGRCDRVKFFRFIILFSFLGTFPLGQSLAQGEPESEEAFLAAVEAEL